MTDLAGNQIIHSESFIIPKGQWATSEISVGEWKIKARFSFEVSLPDTDKGPSVKFDATAEGADIRFVGWDNSLGSAINSPVELGRTNTGRKLLFLACHWKVGDIDKLDIQVMLEGPS